MATTIAPAPSDLGADDPRNPWTPSPAGRIARLAVFAVIVALAIAAPLIVPDVQANLVTRAFVFGIIALSMNMLIGYTGTVSLGHQAFVGVGAFTAAYILTNAGLPWLVAVAGAMVVGALQALLIGVLALRVQGFFFAIVTLAYGLFTKEVVFNITALTGGGAGAQAPRPAFVEPAADYTGAISGDVRYAWLALAFLAFVWVLDWRFTASRGGRAVQALRDDSRVAASWGINVRAFTLLAFGLSGAVAGLAGALFASTQVFVSPESFTLTVALTYVLMTTVGGVGSRPGVVMGGFVFAGLAPILTALHDTPGWGVSEGAIGEESAIEVCGNLPPRITAFVFGLVLVGVGIEAIRHLAVGERRAPWQRVLGGVILLGALYLGAVVGLGGAFGVGVLGDPYCIFTSITPLIEPVIGVVLLLVTLIQFPGGIAEQIEAPLRWLSFGKFHEERSASVGGGSAAGSSSMRP